MEQPVERSEHTEIPKWVKMGRPHPVEPEVAKQRSASDDQVLEMLTSAGWHHFVDDVAQVARPLHRLLIGGMAGAGPEAEWHARGALAVLDKVLCAAYGRAGLVYPEYLAGLLGGSIP